MADHRDVQVQEEQLGRPLTTVQRLLSSSQDATQSEICSAVAAHFGPWFSAEALQQVPVLTHETAERLPANGLVRFRGMVVDTFNPEFFLGAYKTQQSGNSWRPAALYTDDPPTDVDAATQSRIMERRPLLLTPLPAEQPWATAAWVGQPVEPQTPSATDRVKRSRDTLGGFGSAGVGAANPAAEGSHTDASAGEEAMADAPSAKKTPKQDKGVVGVVHSDAEAAEASGLHPETQQARDQGAAAAAAAGNSTGAPQQQQQQATGAAVVDEHAQQQPTYTPGDCIVQVYVSTDSLKLHDVVEVLGVLSFVPALAALQHINNRHAANNHHNHHHQQQQQEGAGSLGGDAAAAAAGGGGGGGGGNNADQGGAEEAMRGAADAAGADADAGMMDVDGDDEFWQERVAVLPPTSQVMRLHALAIRKISPNPLTPTSSSSSSIMSHPHLRPADVVAVLRQKAISLLAAPLAGDTLAAEYLLLTCLSKVVGRESGAAVGVIPLNITHCPSSSSSTGKVSQLVSGLCCALGCLMPHVVHLPLSLTSLNSRRWYPQQHGGTGRLFRGCLQQAEGTLLLLDETNMTTGQLGENGVKNLQALRQLLAEQQLPCGCQVYTHTLQVDQPAVLISTAGRSLLRDSCNMLQLPLQPQHPVLLKPPAITHDGSTAPPHPAPAAAAGAGGCVVSWDQADVAGPEAVAAAAAALPELDAVRRYLCAARGLAVQLDQGAAEGCVARFRSMQAAQPGLGLEELNTLITLSKLLSASLGQELFSMDSWDRAVQLERLRQERVAAVMGQQQH